MLFYCSIDKLQSHETDVALDLGYILGISINVFPMKPFRQYLSRWASR